MRRRLAPALFALALIGSNAAAAAVHGLIVQLKDAPSHEALAREHALSGTHRPELLRQQARWQRVLRDARLTGLTDKSSAPPRLMPTGRAAKRIRVDHTLSGAELEALVQRLRQSAEVDWVVPDEREGLQQNVTPSDPMFGGTSGQWWLQPVSGSDGNAIEARLRGVPGLQRAWIQSTGQPAPPVAVLDTGTTGHSELLGRLLPGYDMVSDAEFANDGDGRDADPSDPGDWVSEADRGLAAFASCKQRDSSWHGTVIAGLMAASTDNNEGVAAINWQGRVVPVRVAGKCGAAVSDIVDGMRWAAGLAVPDGSGGLLPRNPNPARVLSLSFGAYAACNLAYQSAIDELRAVGAVVVAAAGNQHGAVLRPASCRGVVAVAAVNRDGFKTSYSNFGPQVTIATVGGDDDSGAWGALLSDRGLLTLADHGPRRPVAQGYARSAGTSFAAPIVAGTIGLMLGLNPSLTVDQIVTGLTVSARPHVTSPSMAACSFANPGRCLCTRATCGAGLLDAEQALYYAANPALYAVPARMPEVLDSAELREAAALGADRPGQAATVPEAGTGGGAVQWGWLAALAALVLALTRVPSGYALRNSPLGRPGGFTGLPSGCALRNSPLGRPGGLMAARSRRA